MAEFKEFEGKDLDDCISQALRWFDCNREMLEIEIIQEAKAALFGLVGGRKARLRARRATLPVSGISGDDLPDAMERDAEFAGADQAEDADAADMGAPVEMDMAGEHESDDDMMDNVDDSLESTRWPIVPLEELDQQRLSAALLEITGNLIRPLAGRDVDMSLDLRHGRPRIRIDWQGDAGILIGREGQTLVALQYLVSRMISRAMKATLRVQLDIGDYRARQDGKLKALAFSLAEKARRAGRPFSTRPLSSYHRRIIHMCLQKIPDVQTSSVGDGPLKRVLVSPRRQ